MSDLKFYTNPMSRGQTVRWMLEEIGQPYDTEILDYASTMKAEPYLSINPMGKVPAIAHKGKVVTEVAAAGDFWEAEPEHQDYLERYPNGYTCHFIRPNWKLPVREKNRGTPATAAE